MGAQPGAVGSPARGTAVPGCHPVWASRRRPARGPGGGAQLSFQRAWQRACVRHGSAPGPRPCAGFLSGMRGGSQVAGAQARPLATAIGPRMPSLASAAVHNAAAHRLPSQGATKNRVVWDPCKGRNFQLSPLCGRASTAETFAPDFKRGCLVRLRRHAHSWGHAMHSRIAPLVQVT